MPHIVHDVDRDGLGAASMLCAELGPASVVLHPTKSKDIGRILANLDGKVFVLDLPSPPTWDSLPRHLDVAWVDHHTAAWASPPPANVRAILPTTDKPTTTMSLLVRHQLVRIPNVLGYVRNLCGAEPEFEWGLAFDSMTRSFPDWPVELAELPKLLALAPAGMPVPTELRPLVEQARLARESCRAILDAAPTRVLDRVVVVETADAEGIPLAQFSLELQRRFPDRAAVLVHRRSLFYCGRSSARPGLNFVSYFRGRGLDPKGHPYVATTRVPTHQIDAELVDLLSAIEDPSQ